MTGPNGKIKTLIDLFGARSRSRRCAELFFEEYGEYFTEKKKCLVIEACRMHDWGKSESDFQGVSKFSSG